MTAVSELSESASTMLVSAEVRSSCLHACKSSEPRKSVWRSREVGAGFTQAEIFRAITLASTVIQARENTRRRCSDLSYKQLTCMKGCSRASCHAMKANYRSNDDSNGP